MNLIYLGISGVLHPSWSFYSDVHGHAPEVDGHAKYQSVPDLVEVLEGWPDAAIMLTSTQPWSKGLPEVLAHLGNLAPRVLGHTFADLTERAPVGRRGRPLWAEDYWRLSKSQIVDLHVRWFRPQRWIVIDDEDIRWPYEVANDRLVLTSGCSGLGCPAAIDRLRTVLHHNFGPAQRSG